MQESIGIVYFVSTVARFVTRTPSHSNPISPLYRVILNDEPYSTRRCTSEWTLSHGKSLDIELPGIGRRS
jgi:hypothetical protein